MKKYTIIGIGEVLWDMLPHGKEFGGAPANFAFHAQNQGADAYIISSIGSDANGDEIKAVLESRKLNYIFNESSNPSSTVSVELTDGIPQYIIHENVAWDEIILGDVARQKLQQADAVCFGSLAQRSTVSWQSIRDALKLVPANALKIFDINLRQSYYSKELINESLNLANVLKLNSEELGIMQQYFNLNENATTACNELVGRFHLQLLALTNGSENSMLFTPEATSLITTPKVKVVDTVGAGDSFTATMAMGILAGKPLSDLHKEAVIYSAQVCMHKGATPVISW